MPTLKPRVSITLEPDVLAAVDRFSDVFEEKRATVIADLIATAVPQLTRAAHLMEVAKASPDRIKERFRDDLARATTDILGDVDAASKALDGFLGEMQGELNLELRRPRAGTGAGDVPARGRRRNGPKDPLLLTGGSK